MILISGNDQTSSRLPTFSLSSPKAVQTTATVALARHHHIDLTAAALRAHKPLAPLKDGVSASYRRACSVGSGSTWCWHSLHQTISRTLAVAALPSVIGGPGSDFIARHLPEWQNRRQTGLC
jgi:hypothetical protein